MFGVISEQYLFKFSHWEISLTSPLAHLLEAKYLWISELLGFPFIYWLISQKTDLTRFCAKEVKNLFPLLLQADICCFPDASVVEILPKEILSHYPNKIAALQNLQVSSFVGIYKVFLIIMFPFQCSDLCLTHHLMSLSGSIFTIFSTFYFLFPYFFPTNPGFFSSLINTLNISWNRNMSFSFYRGFWLFSDKFNYRIFLFGFRSKVSHLHF